MGDVEDQIIHMGEKLWNCCIKSQVKNQEKKQPKTIEKNAFCLRLFFLSKVREAASFTLIQAKKINAALREILFCLFNWEESSVGYFFSWHLKDTTQRYKKLKYM